MPVLLIDHFEGGISSNPKIGLLGSCRFSRGCDIHSEPGTLKVSPASTKDSGTVVTDLVKFATTNTINTNIYFLGDTGCVYKKSSGVYTKIATYSNAQGMNFFNGTGNVIFCSGDKEYKLNPASDAITTGRTLNNSDYHPAECFLDKVFIGNGRELISTDGSGINYDSTTIGGGIMVEYGYKIKCLKNIGGWLFIGCSSDNSSTGKHYLWDGTSEFFNYGKTLKGEDGINSAEVSDDGSVIISAGKKGHLYQLVGLDSPLEPKSPLPRIELDKTIEVFPGAMTNYQGKVLFGLSDGTSVTAERGVYSWASHSSQYPKVPNLDYSISTGTGTGTTLQIGCVMAANTTDLYVGWRDGTSYGVDKIDGTGVQTTSIYESLIHDDNGKAFIKKFYKTFKVNLAKVLATGEVVTVYYKKDRGSWVSLGTIDFAVDDAVSEKTFKPSSQLKAKEMEVKVTTTNSSTTAPDIDCIAVEFEDEEFI